jgi:hypothetical protein
MDPRSAAHRFALRRVRGTQLLEAIFIRTKKMLPRLKPRPDGFDVLIA